MSLGYFKANNWKAKTLAVSPEFVEFATENDLLKTIQTDSDIVRLSAFSAKWTRLLGFGGIGFRAYSALKAAGEQILQNDNADAVYFSSTVFASFLLGPKWKKKFGVPYFIDYQDPWWSDYYSRPGAPNPPGGWLKYGIVQWLAKRYEGMVIRDASGVTCVSKAYVDMLRRRYPDIPQEKFIELPFGAPENDYEVIRTSLQKSGDIEPKAGIRNHEIWRYIGRGGSDMSVAVRIFGKILEGLRQIGETRHAQIKFEIVGTSYATRGRPSKTIEPILKEQCPAIAAVESTGRIGYMETLRKLLNSDRLVLFGSDDMGYTASKLYPYILAKRPLLVICREESSVARIVRETKSAELITFGERDIGYGISDMGKEMKIKKEWEEAMGRWLVMDPAKEPATDWKAFERYTAKRMTETLCRFFDERLGNGI